MKPFWLLFGLCFFLVGCGTPDVSTQSSTPQADSQPESVQADVYQNTRFGYAFEIPDKMDLYALTEEQTAVSASGDSEVIFLVEGETNFFTVRGMEDTRSPHEWLSQNLVFFYPTGDAAQRVGEISGQQAIFLRGSGTATSPARLIVFQLHGNLLVITYEQDSQAFDRLMETFEILDAGF